MKKICIALIICISIVGCSYEKTYYIPQTKMYVKTIFRWGEDFGYIMFSNDSIINLSKEIDYVKSSRDLSAIFVLNTTNKNNIGIYYNGNVIEVNSVKYHFIHDINETDTMYFETRYQTNPLIIKEPYFKFVISDYFNRALMKNHGIECFTEIKPIPFKV